MDTSTPTPAELRAESIPRSADRLDILAAFAMNIARLQHDVADRLAIISPLDAAERLPPLTKAFDSTARTIRQTIALEHRLHTDAIRGCEHRTSARRRIIRRLEDRIDTVEPVERENLLRDLHERLEDPNLDDDPNLDEDINTRPIDEIIADIERDLGIAAPQPPPVKPRSIDDVRALTRRARQTGRQSAPLDGIDDPTSVIWSHGTVPT